MKISGERKAVKINNETNTKILSLPKNYTTISKCNKYNLHFEQQIFISYKQTKQNNNINCQIF